MMKLADKILVLRKRLGMSQEDLAGRLNVSRQAVSRWESGSALPDASNILHLSKLFGVTADYLLNDDYEEACGGSSAHEKSERGSSVNACTESGENPHRVSAANGSHESSRNMPGIGLDETVKKEKKYKILGWSIAAAGFLGNSIIYILSRMNKVKVPRITYDESGRKWYHWNTEIKTYSYKFFVSAYNLELLTAAFWGMIIAGLLFVFFIPFIRRKAKQATLLSAENGGDTAGTESSGPADWQGFPRDSR